MEKTGRDWTNEFPKEEGFYWFYGWDSTVVYHLEPKLTIAVFCHYLYVGLVCHINGAVRIDTGHLLQVSQSRTQLQQQRTQ